MEIFRATGAIKLANEIYQAGRQASRQTDRQAGRKEGRKEGPVRRNTDQKSLF